MKKVDVKTKGIISIFVALLFLVPSVTAFNAGNGTTILMEDSIEEPINVMNEEVKESVRTTTSEQKMQGELPSYMMESSKLINTNPYNSEVIRRENPNYFYIKPKMMVHNPIEFDLVQTPGTYNTESKSETSSDGTRSSRANDDVELWNIKWGVKNSGLCEATDPDAADYPDDPANWFDDNQASVGSFFVKESTTITVTVRNSGLTAVTNVPVNLTIQDRIHDLQPMKRNPTTKTISSISPGQNGEVSFTWTPPYATTNSAISASVDWPDDPDISNNGFGWRGIKICKWWDDLESGVSSWSSNARTDITGTATDDWGITTSAYAQTDSTHTQTDSWYLGNNDAPGAIYPGDSYRNNNAFSLVSPAANMIVSGTDGVDTTVWSEFMGYVGGGVYDGWPVYMYHMTSVNWLMNGVTEENANAQSWVEYTSTSDILFTGEVSDDGGASWGKGLNMAWAGQLGTVGETEWYNYWVYSADTTNSRIIYFAGMPFNWNVSDSNWGSIKFRHTFDSDNENDQELGFYLDDFYIIGNDNYTIPYRVGMTEFTIPEVNSVPIVHSSDTVSFSSTVKNYGATKTFNVYVNIKDKDTGEELDQLQKSVTNLQADNEATQQWLWSPTREGDFVLTITAGEPDQDWTPSDNKMSRLVHVRDPADNDVLVVDDDNGILNGGNFYTEVEDKMLDALDDVEIEYDVYTVDTNETGPSFSVMMEYTTVIWLTGLDNQHANHYLRENYQSNPDLKAWDISLKADDADALEDFLDIPDHNLWLISPTFLYDQYGTATKFTDDGTFENEYLHILKCKANVTERDTNGDITTQGTPDPLEGKEGTLADGASYTTYETEPPKYFDDIGCTVQGDHTADPDTDPTQDIFYQNPNTHNTYNAISYAGDSENQYKTVFFGFNFYLISDPTDRADIVDRVLTFFGMMGGVQMELMDLDSVKYVEPSGEIDFQFKVTNTGKKTDTMTLDSEIYSSTTASSATWPVHKIEIGGVVKSTVDVAGTSSSKNYKDNIYLKITAPDWEKSSAMWNTEYTFVVTVESAKTGNTSYAVVTAVIKLYSDLSITFSKISKEIEVDDSWDCVITLKNNTNGGENYDVALKIDGEGKDLATFLENDQKTITVTLTPNTARQVIVKIKSGENELAGNHNINIEVKGSSTGIIHETTTIETIVTQFYEVSINSTDETRIVIDPNDIAGDTISESFNIKVFNWGNGYDEVTFTIESHEDNEVDDELLEDIGMKFDGNELETEFDDIDSVLRTSDTIAVEYYDKSNEPEFYGVQEITVTINMNRSITHGEYWFNVIVESQEGLNDEEDPENNNITLMIKIIKPDLIFSPQDLNDTTYDEYPDRVIDNYRFIDDFYEEPIPLDDIEEEFIVTLDHRTDRDDDKGTYGKVITISLEIVIDNIGDSTANLERALQSFIINVSHEEENEFGDYVIIVDAILYPISPTTAEIKPGQNLTVTFETFTVYWMDPSQDTEVVYTFVVTVDNNDYVMEQDEFNNDDVFELTVLHLKKPKKSSSGSPGFELVILFAAIAVALLAGMGRTKRRRK